MVTLPYKQHILDHGHKLETEIEIHAELALAFLSIIELQRYRHLFFCGGFGPASFGLLSGGEPEWAFSAAYVTEPCGLLRFYHPLRISENCLRPSPDVPLAVQLAQVITYIHSQRIVHGGTVISSILVLLELLSII